MCSEVITKRTGKIIKIALISNFGAVKLGNANNGALITVEKSTVIFYLSLVLIKIIFSLFFIYAKPSIT